MSRHYGSYQHIETTSLAIIYTPVYAIAQRGQILID